HTFSIAYVGVPGSSNGNDACVLASIEGPCSSLDQARSKGSRRPPFSRGGAVDASDGRFLESSARRAREVEHRLSAVSSLGSCGPVGSVARDTRRAASGVLLADR